MTNKYDDKLTELMNVFGDIRLLNEEENEYDKVLDTLFKDTRIELFKITENEEKKI